MTIAPQSCATMIAVTYRWMREQDFALSWSEEDLVPAVTVEGSLG
jgi:hypothetical protein